MRKPKVFWVSISAVIICFHGMAFAKELRVGNNVNEIYLRLDGATSIKFEPSKDTFKVVDLSYSGIDHNPISIKDDGKKIILEQTQKEWTNMNIGYTLIVPEGKNIFIDAGLVNLSGELIAREINVKGGQISANMKLLVNGRATIKAGSGNLNMNFVKCGELNVSGGNINGSITVPQGTRVSAPTKHWQPLKVYEVPSTSDQ